MLQNYLSQYGYLPPANPENGAFLSEEKLVAAIEEFQAFAGLNITGIKKNLHIYNLHITGASSGITYVPICLNFIFNVARIAYTCICNGDTNNRV